MRGGERTGRSNGADRAARTGPAERAGRSEGGGQTGRRERAGQAARSERNERTLLEEIAGMHRELRELLARIDALPFGDERFRTLVDQAGADLLRHARLERNHLFPTVRAYLTRGETLAERELADHARIERALTGLTGLTPADPVFATRLDALMQTVRCHFARQEEHLFPHLRDMVPGWRLRALGEEARRSVRSAAKGAGPPLTAR
jgi:hypothetical protein